MAAAQGPPAAPDRLAGLLRRPPKPCDRSAISDPAGLNRRLATGTAGSPLTMTAAKVSEDHSLAASLRPFLRLRRDELTLGEMLDRVEGHDGPGPVLFILTLPVLLPLPPGFSMVLALPLLLVAPQVILGRERVWLPRFLRERSIKREALVKVIRRVLSPVEKIETVVRPRLGFLTGRIGSALVGVACTILAVVLVLPIPFANLAPSIAMGLFSVGLTRKDGLFVLAGYGVMVLAACLIALGVHGFGVGLRDLRSLF